jgi:hypothetical protein
MYRYISFTKLKHLIFPNEGSSLQHDKIKQGCFSHESNYDSLNLHRGHGGLSSLESHDVHGEIPERMLVQGLE